MLYSKYLVEIKIIEPMDLEHPGQTPKTVGAGSATVMRQNQWVWGGDSSQWAWTGTQAAQEHTRVELEDGQLSFSSQEEHTQKE